VAMTLAQMLESDERAGLALPALLSFAQRAERYPEGAYGFPIEALGAQR